MTGESLDGKRSWDEQEIARAEFARKAAIVRAQLKSMEGCTLQPNGKFLRQWDKITACALFYTAFMTPWEVGFLPSGFWEPHWMSMALFVVNRSVDAVFLIDICCQFFIPFRNKEGLWCGPVLLHAHTSMLSSTIDPLGCLVCSGSSGIGPWPRVT